MAGERAARSDVADLAAGDGLRPRRLLRLSLFILVAQLLFWGFYAAPWGPVNTQAAIARIETTQAELAELKAPTVDLDTGAFENLYTRFGDNLPLKSPNDLVFDRHGGFYFSEHGKIRPRDHDMGGVFYAKADGSEIIEIANHMHGPNGVGLSPDHKTLYVAETWSRQLWAFPIEAPGQLGRDPKALFGHGGRFMAGAPGFRFFDSLAVDSAGNVCVATPGEGLIVVYDPDGREVDVIETGDPLTTNIAFGGPNLQTAYITLAGTGRLVAMDWPVPGVPLVHLNEPG